jgi:hypothetical protein
MKLFVKNIFWVLYFLFVFIAIIFSWKEDLLSSKGAFGFGKYIFWLAFLSFTAYSIYCSQKENIFKTIQKVAQFHWGRQIGFDLYIGLFIFLFFISLIEKSILIASLWILPTLFFGNLSPLLYLALRYDEIILRFLN